MSQAPRPTRRIIAIAGALALALGGGSVAMRPALAELCDDAGLSICLEDPGYDEGSAGLAESAAEPEDSAEPSEPVAEPEESAEPAESVAEPEDSAEPSESVAEPQQEEEKKVADAAIRRAMEVLEASTACQEAVGGTNSAFTPNQILYTMAYDNGHIELHPNESSRPAGAYAVTENATSSWGSPNGSKAVMKLFDLFWAVDATTKRTELSVPDFQALVILHELGHAMGTLGVDTLYGTSKAVTEAVDKWEENVVRHCF